jgi:hypothetical protein
MEATAILNFRPCTTPFLEAPTERGSVSWMNDRRTENRAAQRWPTVVVSLQSRLVVAVGKLCRNQRAVEAKQSIESLIQARILVAFALDSPSSSCCQWSLRLDQNCTGTERLGSAKNSHTATWTARDGSVADRCADAMRHDASSSSSSRRSGCCCFRPCRNLWRRINCVGSC